jgi:competence protein ComEA
MKDVYQKMGRMDKWLVVFVILGVSIAVTSLFRGILMSRQVQIEYLDSSKTANIEAKLVVDIEGAVNKPGVYELQLGSRTKDILVMAGGYAEKADREYCEKTLNLASPIKDGQKIYIPFVSDTPASAGYSEAKNGSKLININTASESELDTLWGIGAARIESIVKNRPYGSVEELVTKKVFTKQILEKNSDKITVF